jgi:hypothetical protein
MQQTAADRAEKKSSKHIYTRTFTSDAQINKPFTHASHSLLPLFVSTTCQPLLICKPGRKKLSAAAAAALPFSIVSGVRGASAKERNRTAFSVTFAELEQKTKLHAISLLSFGGN